MELVSQLECSSHAKQTIKLQGASLHTKHYSHKSAPHDHTHLFGSPLESSDHRVFDLVEVLHSLSTVHEEVRASSLRAKAPDLTSLVHFVLVLFHEVAGTCLGLLTGSDLTLCECGGKEGRG